MVLQQPAPQTDPRLLQDRKLSGTISHVAICPKMDLLAIILDKNSLAIFRTNWQRLATISISTKESHRITALAWSPDGANIAVATSAADLAIYSVDRSSFVSTGKTKRAARDAAGPIATVSLEAAAACIQWVSMPRPSDRNRVQDEAYYDRAAALLGRDTHGNRDIVAPGMLFVGDCKGMLSVLMHDLLFMVIRKRVMPVGCALEGLNISQDLQRCFAVGRSSNENENCVPGPEFEQWSLRCVDMRHVTDFLPEIERVGVEVVALQKFVSNLTKVSETIEKEWVKGASDVPKSNIIKPLEKAIVEFAEEGIQTAWDVLHDTFCGARVQGAVFHFLAGELGENGAKDSLRAFRNHVDLVSDALHALLPLSENIMFRSSEYRALARLTGRFKNVGVHADLADRFVELAESLYFKLGEITWGIENVANQTEAFLAWLVLAAARAGGDSTQGRGLLSSNVGGQDALLVSEFFQAATRSDCAEIDSGDENDVSHMFRNGLEEVAALFQAHCDLVVSKSSESISSCLSIASGIDIRIPRLSGDSKTKFSFSRFLQDGSFITEPLFINIITTQGNLVSVQYNTMEKNWYIAHLSLQSEERFAHDAAMQNHHLIALTTKNREGGVAQEGCQAFRLSLLNFRPGNCVYEMVGGTGNGFLSIDLPAAQDLPTETNGEIQIDYPDIATSLWLTSNPERNIAT